MNKGMRAQCFIIFVVIPFVLFRSCKIFLSQRTTVCRRIETLPVYPNCTVHRHRILTLCVYINTHTDAVVESGPLNSQRHTNNHTSLHFPFPSYPQTSKFSVSALLWLSFVFPDGTCVHIMAVRVVDGE
jgi:hypothetical protein